ncbi:MAG: diguanylate cyclase [Candidatus Desulfofervidus auxilii]|nr:diguanylate cyclase [Candidatus Desulfofervidus auxilii]
MFASSFKVVLVEDNESIAKLLLLILEDHNFETKWVFLGNKVINTCLEKIPDLIILDPILPDKEGFELLKEIKSHIILSEIPIVLILDEEKQKGRFLRFSPLDILVKPVNLNELSLKIKNWVGFLENQKTLKKKAMTDALTGLMNDLALEKELTIACYYAEKFGKNFSTLMIDVDYFTKYNNIYGHRFGDSLLQTLAVFWKGALRPTDAIFRYKGPSFVAILQDTPLEQGINAAERLRRITYERSLPHQQGLNNVVTISIGVTAFKKGDTPGIILHRAASYLTKAKKSGRNVVKSGI